MSSPTEPNPSRTPSGATVHGTTDDRDGSREQRFFAIVIVTLAVLALVGGLIASRQLRRAPRWDPVDSAAEARRNPTLPLPRPLPDFTLVDTSGQPVVRADLAGRFVVVNFVFTSCSTACLAVNDRMTEIQRLVANAPDVILVSLTVDPRTDTPEVLGDFARRFGADPARWRFLGGPKTAVYGLIETAFLRSFRDLDTLIPGGFMGTDRIMLVDRQGLVCAAFDGLQPDAAGTVVSRIDQLRSETPSP